MPATHWAQKVLALRNCILLAGGNAARRLCVRARHVDQKHTGSGHADSWPLLSCRRLPDHHTTSREHAPRLQCDPLRYIGCRAASPPHQNPHPLPSQSRQCTHIPRKRSIPWARLFRIPLGSKPTPLPDHSSCAKHKRGGPTTSACRGRRAFRPRCGRQGLGLGARPSLANDNVMLRNEPLMVRRLPRKPTPDRPEGFSLGHAQPSQIAFGCCKKGFRWSVDFRQNLHLGEGMASVWGTSNPRK